MKSLIKIALGVLSVYILSIAYAASTQSVVQPNSIPDDYICIKDTMPDSYFCLPASKGPAPWYLDTEHAS
jgi:hypothetical protein